MSNDIASQGTQDHLWMSDACSMDCATHFIMSISDQIDLTNDQSPKSLGIWKYSVPLENDQEDKLLAFLKSVAPILSQEIRDQEEVREALDKARQQKQQDKQHE